MSTEAKYQGIVAPARRTRRAPQTLNRRARTAQQRMDDLGSFEKAIAALKEWDSTEARESCRIAYDRIRPFLRSYFVSNTPEEAFLEAIAGENPSGEAFCVEDCYNLLSPGIRKYVRHLKMLDPKAN
jgi:hypothetical protein